MFTDVRTERMRVIGLGKSGGNRYGEMIPMWVTDI
jgi:hypothetical protein